MRTLYVDNFRGFADTFIPLRDVNFLVGENSTGKSSILSLINLFGEPHFWFNQDFNAGGVGLGTFDDIVSADSEDRKYFQVGLIEVRPRREGRKPRPTAFVLRFVQKQGLPVIERLDLLEDNLLLRAEFHSHGATYQLEETDCASADDIQSKFRELCSSQRLPATYSKRLPRYPMARRYIIPLVEGILFAHKSKKQSDSRDESASEPSIGVLVPFPQPISAIAPVRTKPQRTYDECAQEFSAEGAHTPFLIRKLRKAGKSRPLFDVYLARFGENSGLFKTVGVREFGRQPASPFAIEITLARNALNLRNVGYGVSQSLPVVVELFAQPKRSMISVQQPEVHLHPRAQAALGDVFFKLAVEDSKVLFIETHSDFAIDRFRLNYRKADKKPNAQVLFFERTNRGNSVTPLPFTSTGGYPVDQPMAFRSFFLKEQLDMLGG